MISVRVPREALEAIDALAGPGKRAQFIREAVAAELERRGEDVARQKLVELAADPAALYAALQKLAKQG